MASYGVECCGLKRMNTETKKRNPVFDVAKFLVMLLVIAGHLTGNGIVERGSGVSFLSNANIGVAMPLFFSISGYFAAKLLGTGDVAKIVARIVGFLWPLAAFGIVFGFILLGCGKIPAWKAALYPAARVCYGSWFLTTLAVIYAIVAIVWKFVRQMKWRVAVLLLVYATLFFISGQSGVPTWLREEYVFHMLPYFCFGVLLLRPYELYKRWRIAIPCGIIFLAVIFLEGDVRTNGMSFYWVPVDWQTIVSDKHLFLCFGARTAVGVTGSVFVLYVIDLLLMKAPWLSMFAVFGMTTLGVYVMHEWPLIQVHEYYSFEPLSAYWRLPLALILFFAFHYVTVAIKANNTLKCLFFGDEKWLSGVIKQWIQVRR